MSTGMTYNAVLDDLDLPALEGFNRYWLGHPPVHIMMATYFGIKDEAKKTDANSEQTLAELMATFPMSPKR